KHDKYCYLDSDVIAVSDKVDNIFQYEPEPILFARDNCIFSEFSPHAMNCNCVEKFHKKNRFFKKIEATFPLPVFSPKTIKATEDERNKLKQHFNKIKTNKFRYFFTALGYLLKRYLLPVNSVSFFEFRFNKKNRCWYDSNGRMIDFDYSYYYKLLKKRYRIKYNTNKQRWENAKGTDITPDTPRCSHLSQHLNQKYGVVIPDNWQHWNGGVFLFNHYASDFLSYWHRLTVKGFEDKKTKTRDQIMLAVTAWKFGLQHNKTLPKKYNFIAEHDNTNIDSETNMVFTDNNRENLIKPIFLHIYHHWGDKSWHIWQYVCHLGKKHRIL
ncbi:MAG: hypothetical protein ACQES1_06105, partial [Bacteroidota bacterium]